MDDKKTIIIVGRSGNGKTSLAKTISGKAHPLTNEDKKPDSYLQVEQYDGTRYDALVWPCIEDSEYDFEAIKRVAKETIEKWGKGRGIDAVIFAMKYGVRYTKEDVNVVDIAKTLFGEDVFAKRAVLAFSYGDIFEYDKDMEAQIAFKEWCEQHEGSLKKLFKEVNYRCVLFDNKAKTHDESLRHFEIFIDEILKANRKEEYKIQVVQGITPSQKVESLDDKQMKRFINFTEKKAKKNVRSRIEQLEVLEKTEQRRLKNKRDESKKQNTKTNHGQLCFSTFRFRCLLGNNDD